MTRGTNNAGPAGDKGTSGQNVPKSPKGPKTKKSKFRMESEQEKISKSKLRMETREDKLNRARKKLEGKKPPKPRGPVRRVLGAAGWNVHGFVHGKVYEVEHENVGTEGAHRSELVGEAALRHGTRYAKKRIREHPARAVHSAVHYGIDRWEDGIGQGCPQNHGESGSADRRLRFSYFLAMIPCPKAYST